MLNKYYIFYSKKCKLSNDCLNLINNSNILIKKLCVDTSNPNNLLRAGITHVPCLYDKFNNEKIFGSSVIKVLTLLVNQFSVSTAPNINQHPIIPTVTWNQPQTKSVIFYKKSIFKNSKQNTKSVLGAVSKKNVQNENSVNNTNNGNKSNQNTNVQNNGNIDVNQNTDKDSSKFDFDKNYDSMFVYAGSGLEFTSLEGDIVKDSQWEGLTGTNNVIPESFEKNDSFQNKNNQEFDKKMQDMINERSKIK